MRLLCLGCEVLARAVYYCAAYSPHIVDVNLFQQGLHDTPSDLRLKLQTQIDAAVGQGYDAVVLSYGLCGKATEGLKAKEVPLVIPRAHDCITLFLGSRERYQQEFVKNPGTYWFANDYVERGKRAGSTLTMGSVGPNSDTQALYGQYVAKYGKDNADYLMEVMGAWSKHYNRAVFVDMGVGDASIAERKARENAEKRGWNFERIAGDLVLIRRLLDGEWENDFLVLQPGEAVALSYDEQVICRKSANQ
jgi:hypothetical protein